MNATFNLSDFVKYITNDSRCKHFIRNFFSADVAAGILIFTMQNANTIFLNA